MLKCDTRGGFCILWIITFISIKAIIGACPKYECGNGECYGSKDICDGVEDCDDVSDERDCDRRKCEKEGKFTCANHICIHAIYVCDGDANCKDGSDETNCTIACDSKVFKCQDGSCIQQNLVCNHIKNCADGSDELNCTEKLSPEKINETWDEHDELLSRQYMDDQVVFYFDSKVDPSITWPFDPISKAWKYVKETYGSFGPNPLLYVVMHSEIEDDSDDESSTASFREVSHGYRNIIDCGQSDLSLDIKHSIIFNTLITAFGGVIRKGAKEVLNDADEAVCGDEMQAIISYDVYKYTKDPSEEMDTWVANKLTESDKKFFWFRDWFLPIYEIYGGASALERFYNLTYNYFPHTKTEYNEYLNEGEFVHFWSGATGSDLKPLARQAFNCSENCRREIRKAQKEYSSLEYTVSNYILGFSDTDLAIYFQSYQRYPISFYHKISNVWQYVKIHYGPFPHHSSPTVVLNNDTTTNNSCESLQESQKSVNNPKLYIIICHPLITLQENAFLDEIITHIGAMVIKLQSKTENWWPAFGVSGWTMVSIIVYDIYESLESPEDANRWLGNKRKESLSFPRDNTLWFQNWYLEIYNKHGKSQALIRFLNLLDSKWKTEQLLNTGEFVHFWSGATGTNLQTLAEKLMGWNTTYQQQLDDARKALRFNSGFNYTYDDSHTTSGKRILSAESTGGATVGIIIGILAVVLFGVLVIGGIKFYGYKRKIEILSVAIRKLTTDEVNEFYEGNPNLSKTEVNAPIQSQPFNKKYLIPRVALSVDEGEVLGSGEFGVVRSGRLTDEKQGASDLKVAVKTVKPNVKVDHFKALLSEIKILAFLGRHESIASLLGIVTDNVVNREVFVVLEFCGKGDLLRYLRAKPGNFQNLFKSNVGKESKCVYKSGHNAMVTIEPVSTSNAATSCEDSPISTLDLVKWSRQIAHGMEYISSKNVIHGDLAARNVLLTYDNIAKIGDFGLSRQLLNYSDYRKTSKSLVPWRWLAIESLTTMTFSVHSDIWSYGVTLWEIFNLGKLPYANQTWTQEFVNELTEGQRLSAPDFGNREMNQLMLDCMKHVPSERASFQLIISILNTIEGNLESNTPTTSPNGHYITLNENPTL